MDEKKLYFESLSEDNDMGFVEEPLDYNYNYGTELNPDVMAMLNKRVEKIENGVAKFYTWEEMHDWYLQLKAAPSELRKQHSEFWQQRSL